MKIRRRQLLAAAAAWAGAARGQSFPARPVTLVVPYSVGIGPDVVARSLAAQLQPRWGQPVIVDNRPGAAGIVAFSQVRRTPPDGHTLFLADTATLAVNPLLHASLPYDPDVDLQPLTLLFHATFVLFTSARGRFQTLGALLEAARRSPGDVRYAALGHGHPSQLAVELMAREAGLRFEAVHFKDAGTLMSAVAGAQVDFTAIGMNTVAGLVAAGHLRPLAVGARQRLASHPDLPTLAEAGGPPVAMHPWAALVTRSGTPARPAPGRGPGRLRDHALHARRPARAGARRPRALRGPGARRPRRAALRPDLGGLHVHRSALVERPAATMFDLIEAAEHYPQFLPWCAGANILERSDEIVAADLRVQWHGLHFEFGTRNPKRRPEHMAIHLVRGPFRHFEGQWWLRPLSPAACKVEFELDYEFDSGVAARLATPVFARIADTLVDAFVWRALTQPAPP